jgi:hypothetical protein
MENNSLAFNKLPKEVQDKLVEMQTPSDDCYGFFPKVPLFYWVAVAAGLGWCAYMFVATQDYLWEWWMFWLFAGISIILVPLALFALWKIIAPIFSKLKKGYLFTKDECIKTNGNQVEFWNLRELEGFQPIEHLKLIEIWIGERVEKIKAPNYFDAEQLDNKFVEWRNEAKPSFLETYAKPEYAFQSSSTKVITAILLAVFLLFGFGLSYAAKVFNRNFDDHQTWKRTEQSASVAEFEAYKERHPNGNYSTEADKKISDILNKLKDDYVKNAQPTADQNAVQSLSQMFEKFGTPSNRTIYLKISEIRDLDEATVKKMKEFTGLPIQSYDFAVPASQTQYRKDKLLNDISVLFLPATRNAGVKFELSDNPPAGSPIIEVNFSMKSQEIYYRYFWYSNGKLTPYFNPGAKIEFDFALNAPDSQNLYKANYVSQFTNNLGSNTFDMRDAANYSYDKIYFSAVSEDFAKYLSRQFGFAE